MARIRYYPYTYTVNLSRGASHIIERADVVKLVARSYLGGNYAIDVDGTPLRGTRDEQRVIADAVVITVTATECPLLLQVERDEFKQLDDMGFVPHKTRYLEVANEAASLVLPTSATLLTGGTVLEASGRMGSTSGVTTFPVPGCYTWRLLLNAYATAARRLYWYSEASADGHTWTVLPRSARVQTINNQASGQKEFGGVFSVPVRGLKVRSYLWASDTLSAISETIGPGLTVPAMRLMISGPQW